MLNMLRASVARESVDTRDISLSLGTSFHDEYSLGGENVVFYCVLLCFIVFYCVMYVSVTETHS